MNDSPRNMVVLWVILSFVLFGTVYELKKPPLTSQPANSRNQDIDLGGY